MSVNIDGRERRGWRRKTDCDDHVRSCDALQGLCEFRLAEAVEARGGEGGAGADEVEGEVAQRGEHVGGVDCGGRGEEDWRVYPQSSRSTSQVPPSEEERGTHGRSLRQRASLVRG